MRAARYYGHHDIRVEDIEEPVLKERQVLVDVEWTGICGSELHEYLMGPLLTPTKPHPLTGEQIPLTIGHELCGRVRNAPPGSSLKDGEPVTIDPRIHCGSCRPCSGGLTACCEVLGYIGGSTGGGYGERVAVNEDCLYPLGNIPIEYAALIEPLSVVHHAVKESDISDWSQKNVLVLGGGPIGFALLLDLKAHGATNVIVSEPARIRREQIAEFAQATVDPTAEDVVDRCHKLTNGKGIEVVFDCAGVPAALNAAFDVLAYEGHYIMVAVWEKPVSDFVNKCQSCSNPSAAYDPMLEAPHQTHHLQGSRNFQHRRFQRGNGLDAVWTNFWL